MPIMRRFGVRASMAILALVVVLGLALALAWGARTWLAEQAARAWLGAQGLEAQVQIDKLDFSGLVGRVSLGPPKAPVFSVARLDVRFNPDRWIPQIVAVRLTDPVVRAQVDRQGHVTLAGLGALMGAGGASGPSPYVSQSLSVSISGLRAYLATPAGPLEVRGTARLAAGLPVHVALTARPATIAYRNIRVRLEGAQLAYTRASGHLSVRLAGDAESGALAAQGLKIGLEADGLVWRKHRGVLTVSIPRAHLRAVARALDVGTALDQPSLDVTLAGLRAGLGGAVSVDADVVAQADASLAPHIPATGDPGLTRALARNLTYLAMAFQGHVHHEGSKTSFVARAPVTVTGADGAKLTVSSFALEKEGGKAQMRFAMALDGRGLPRVRVGHAALDWRDGALTGSLGMAARFNYAMLRGAEGRGQFGLSWKDGAYALTLRGCAPVRLAQFKPTKMMAGNISASLCPLSATPLLQGGKDGWRLSGLVRGVAADLTLAGVRLDEGAARLAFHGRAGAGPQGQVRITAGQIGDKARPVRFHPVTGDGILALHNGVWRGTLAIRAKDGVTLGNIAITHAMARGQGKAVITAPHLRFVPDAQQPSDLSPLLAAFRQTKGTAAFQGHVNWDRQGMTSGGQLTINGLDFLTPLGEAHSVKSEITFTSLLPPRTAPDQTLRISRIDWTLPFTGVDLTFDFGPQAIAVDSLKAGFAQGQARLGAVTIALGGASHIQGAVSLDSIALSPLVTASNLGSKLTLKGKVSGRIPFVAGPDGVRIRNGHIAADGPGLLSINPALWTQNAAAANAVQDFAYQALEHLAFDQLSADLNSVAGGRLQVVFHIKGHFAPPQPQTARVPLTALLDGTAFKNPIPLPSGTPIDLTLDTSLNFDELLKFYGQAWSNILGSAQEGHSGEKPARGNQ